jgi:hypothetical protein
MERWEGGRELGVQSSTEAKGGKRSEARQGVRIIGRQEQRKGRKEGKFFTSPVRSDGFCSGTSSS